MECRFCQKEFFKGEHLRRHERSHTGARPFSCKECKRPFARHDSLMRHERLHRRKEGLGRSSPPPKAVSSADALNTPCTDGSTAQSIAPMDDGSQNQVWTGQQSAPSSIMGIQDITPASTEPDMPDMPEFDLMWPDSEALFQTLVSQDTMNQWQMPIGVLPFLPGVSSASAAKSPGVPNSFSDRGSSIGAIPTGGGHRAVHDVSNMVTNLSSRVTAAVEANSITSLFLDECLHMFFLRFIPTFPILHRSTFVFRDWTQPLLLNAIAIGSLYIGPKDAIAKGEALWRLAHIATATSWETLITHSGPYDACKGVQLVLTALLGQIYGALSKKKDIRTTSQTFHALGFFWARQCGMFDSEPYSLDDLPSLDAPEEEKDHQWRVWAAKEIQQRALLGHYVVDGLMARMSGRPTSVRHAANEVGLPSSEAAFEASTAHEWLTHMHSQKLPRTSFRSIFRSLFMVSNDGHTINHEFSAFSLRVILEGLQSLVSDCDSDEYATVGVPSKSEVRRALIHFHNILMNSVHLSDADRLEIVLRWHSICLDTCVDSALLSRYLCSRYNISQHIWGGGKGSNSELDLVSWAGTEDARRALLHAIAIQDCVEQLPRGRAHVIHIPSSLFAAATIYTVLSLSGLTTVKLPSMIDWKDVLPRDDDACVILAELSHPCTSSATKRYIQGQPPSTFGTPKSTRNLLYELNSMQKLFRCLSSQWGISYDMEAIMDQWIGLCH